MAANKASSRATTTGRAMILVPLACLVLLASPALSTVQAGFRSPESLVRNVYAYYGDRSSELSSGLPRDAATVDRFFDPSLREAWRASSKPPYDFLVKARPGSSA
jgi:hypothetical protein